MAAGRGCLWTPDMASIHSVCNSRACNLCRAKQSDAGCGGVNKADQVLACLLAAYIPLRGWVRGQKEESTGSCQTGRKWIRMRGGWGGGSRWVVRVGLRGGHGQQGTEDEGPRQRAWHRQRPCRGSRLCGVSKGVFSAFLGFLKVKSTPFQRWFDPPGSRSALLISFCPLKVPLVSPLVIATLRPGSHCEAPAEAALDCDSKAGLFPVAQSTHPTDCKFFEKPITSSPLSLPALVQQSKLCLLLQGSSLLYKGSDNESRAPIMCEGIMQGTGTAEGNKTESLPA